MQKYCQEADVFFTPKSATTGIFNCSPDILVYYYLLQKMRCSWQELHLQYQPFGFPKNRLLLVCDHQLQRLKKYNFEIEKSMSIFSDCRKLSSFLPNIV